MNHIKTCWCDGNEESYNYVLNWFAWILQNPHKKSGVVLALRSKQGGGKGVVISKLDEIIGDTHFCQNSNANYLFGDFNGQLEGKILINLDEAYWGGDKKMEGQMKNKITEKNQTINKKNKEAYKISCYANYVISTNGEWFAGVTEDDRRYYCLELNNKHAGRMTKEKEDYFRPIIDASAGSFAKVLYNRDISDYNPRIFKKTALLQNQVERNWNSVASWWNSVMRDGGFTLGNDFIDWNTIHKEDSYYDDDLKKKCGIKIKNKQGEKKTAYLKTWIHQVYMSVNSDTRKFQDNRFFDYLRNRCLGDLYSEQKIQKKKERRIYIIFPTIQEAREKWNEMQEYEYKYEEEGDEWEVCDDSDED